MDKRIAYFHEGFSIIPMYMRWQFAKVLSRLYSFVPSARSISIDFSDNLRRTMPIVPWSILQATRLEEAAEKRGSFVAMEQ